MKHTIELEGEDIIGAITHKLRADGYEVESVKIELRATEHPQRRRLQPEKVGAKAWDVFAVAVVRPKRETVSRDPRADWEVNGVVR